MKLGRRMILLVCAFAPPVDFLLPPIESGIRYLVWKLSQSDPIAGAEFREPSVFLSVLRFVEWVYPTVAAILFGVGIILLRRATRSGALPIYFYAIWTSFMVSGLTYFFYFIYFNTIVALFYGIVALAVLCRIRETHFWRSDARTTTNQSQREN
jgi:hypothetical protein